MYDRRQLAERLQRALLRQRWSEVRAVAKQLDAAGTNDRTAWRRLLMPFLATKDRTVIRPTPMAAISGQQRFRLWIDAVGGFLVCLGDEIVLGQAASENSPDVPILGDLSRRHALIHRDEEGYVIDPVRLVKIDGRAIERPTTLADGRMIELGNGVRLRFRRPHPLSFTARLELVSHHRTLPALDGVLLMADSCIVGPGPQSHVVARDLAGEVVLFRQGAGLACRTAGQIKIDGTGHEGRGPLTAKSRVEGSDFAFTLEEC
ncbi:MAG TPA: FHA domain-containing protein [Pirellulales bacterium]|jgi:hypothetical protein|nr:FHA domain-containing protein [Pirellulales bacterium]